MHVNIAAAEEEVEMSKRLYKTVIAGITSEVTCPWCSRVDQVLTTLNSWCQALVARICCDDANPRS